MIDGISMEWLDRAAIWHLAGLTWKEADKWMELMGHKQVLNNGELIVTTQYTEFKKIWITVFGG